MTQRSLPSRLRRFAYALPLALLACLAGCGEDAVSEPPLETTSGWPGDFCAPHERSALSADGEEAFSLCTGCHSPDGTGTSLGPNIQQPIVDLASTTVRRGRQEQGYPGGMPSYSEVLLSDVELCSIIAFLREPPKPTSGEGLYLTYCGNCHGDGELGGVGQGGRTRQSLLDFAVDEPERFLAAVRSGFGGSDVRASRDYMPSWQADELSDSDVQLIVDYLAGL
ncbi:MAG: mono/diheme cytochrome c family protein [Bradymonadia bacterium]|jgi:mono/diheme cytochrome c family protein